MNRFLIAVFLIVQFIFAPASGMEFPGEYWQEKTPERLGVDGNITDSKWDLFLKMVSEALDKN